MNENTESKKTDKTADVPAVGVERMVMRNFSDGMTVRELKEMIKDWSEIDVNGEDCGVWIETRRGLSSPVTMSWPLNMREDEDGNLSADFLLASVEGDA